MYMYRCLNSLSTISRKVDRRKLLYICPRISVCQSQVPSLTLAMRFLKVYTRSGDKGRTSTFTGERRAKSDNIFEALGSIDELSSSLGVAREFMTDSNPKSTLNKQIEKVQCLLQDLAAAVATPRCSAREKHLELTSFSEAHVQELENWIDSYTSTLPELKNFIIPSGGKSSSHLHFSRTICRRAERRVIPLVKNGELDAVVLRYLNRLSDFLFTVARVAARHDKCQESVYRKSN